MIATAVKWFTRRHFAVFYRFHIVFALATTACTLMHGFGITVANHQMPVALPGAGIWLLDVLLRLVFVNGVLRNVTSLASVQGSACPKHTVLRFERHGSELQVSVSGRFLQRVREPVAGVPCIAECGTP
jgi:hypothetical protein